MKELSNEEKARVFAMYLGCECNRGCMHTSRIEQTLQGDLPIDVKLLLIPLQDITDEHTIEVGKVIGNVAHLSDDSIIHQVKEIICTNRIYNMQTNVPAIRWMYAFQYLIQKGYAVPLFFGVNHPCNGKTVIELGLAINKNNDDIAQAFKNSKLFQPKQS